MPFKNDVKKKGINFISKETIKYERIDFDRYIFEDVSQLSTKEISVVIDFNTNHIEGDIVAYGDWYDLEYEECLHYLDTLDKKDITRNFQAIRKQCDERKQ